MKKTTNAQLHALSSEEESSATRLLIAACTSGYRSTKAAPGREQLETFRIVRDYDLSSYISMVLMLARGFIADAAFACATPMVPVQTQNTRFLDKKFLRSYTSEGYETLLGYFNSRGV